MDFRTPIHITPSDLNLGHSKPGMVIGSCFSEYMGERMAALKMPVSVNPFGIQFNPLSIVRTLQMLGENRRFTVNDLIRSEDLWVSLNHHGQFSSADPNETLTRINRTAQAGSEALRAAEYLIITLGTSWVYEYIPTGEAVGNCHKLPARMFNRRMLTATEIVSAFDTVLPTFWAGKKIILTVSPIRHLSDGMAENQLSKATLIVAAHQLTARYGGQCLYFPSYEIMMDDLRDYRFYEADMAHPTPLAQEYIWEQFCRFAFSKETEMLFGRIEALQKAMRHKPFNPDTPAHRAFLERMAEQARSLQKEFPHIDLSKEIAYFES